jgi:hypothetical protein
MLHQYKRVIAILLVATLTIAAIIGIPAFCPGFPSPKVTGVDSSCVLIRGTTSVQCTVSTSVVNEGTRGNVVILTKFVNPSRNSIVAKESTTLFMDAKERRSVSTRVTVPLGESPTIVVEAGRRSALNAGF